LRSFTALYYVGKGGIEKTFEAENENLARQMAIVYQQEQNVGEPKSDRIRFIKLKDGK